MVTRRTWSMSLSYWDALSGTELVFIILNFVACIPVLLAVGGFSLYHFHGLMGNTTTIEGWEKDKAATMVRRGKIREIKYPYNIGRRRNIESVLGKNTLYWCCPTSPPGNGLKYELAEGEGFDEGSWPPKDPDRSRYEDPQKGFTLPDSPWTYENGSFNPDLTPSNAQRQHESLTRRRHKPAPVASEYPPYHPDYDPGAVYEEAYDTSSDEDEVIGAPRVRRGSEGYEVRPAGREDMLHRYLEQLGETPGRYHRYIPMPDEESESEAEIVPNGVGQ
ncbi:Palmitoyltransferase [Paramarasmius palmivorus]|uniref:Palmitoyltransferase n=1 Tax=Paramarasmius palmivorus TaxID=297713 RepID=A0AAW0E0G2_9AGAR